MRNPRRLLMAALAACALGTGPLVTATTSGAGATASAHDLATNAHGGHGSASPATVDVSALPNAPSKLSSSNVTRDVSALRMNGSNTFTPTTARPLGAKPSISGPNVVTPTRIYQNFAATDVSQASCNCQPPDSNGAVSSSNIVEADNLSLQVWSKSGSPPTLMKRVSLNTFLAGTTDSLSDPRVFFDNAWQRWILVVIVVPASSTATPAMWFAASKTSNPAGSWWIYRFGFGGASFPAGALLDYPMVGMSSDAVAISTNNFFASCGYCYNNSTVFAFPKERAYNGLGIGFGAFNTDFSAHPAFVEGVPQNLDDQVYVVASLLPYGLAGFDVYSLTNPAHPNVALTYLGRANDPGNFTAGPPPANQPGSGNTQLDTLDGRLQAAPRQSNGLIWFARTVNLSGFPAVQYGAINAANLSGTSDAVAFDSSSSDDWNPSIGVLPSGSSQYVFLNWAFTDPTNNVPTSMRIAGLSTSDSIQNLVGVGVTLVTTSITSETRFGDYSSVSIDPKVARSAVVVNETFDPFGGWQDYIARIGF